MPFIEIPGLTGKVYVPEHTPEEKRKHDCRDCFSCQLCSDDRCELCMGESMDSGRRTDSKALTCECKRCGKGA